MAKKADDQKGEAAAGADGGKGPVVGEIAQHPGIGQIVELLEQLPQKQGEGKGEDTLDDGALGQRRILGSQAALEQCHDFHSSLQDVLSRKS